MHDPALLIPLFALVAWTFAVLLLIPIARIKAVRAGRVTAEDFRMGESAQVPAAVCIPNRNYMNLLELPVLFYVACLMLYLTDGASATVQLLAWAYVALRVAHSLIHLTYNHVIHRLLAFAASNVVLAVLWLMAGVHVLGAAAPA